MDGKPRAKQGCWTCKRRKVGCDKSLPSCNNCVRTGRECQGYGMRLVWPEKLDHRGKERFQSLALLTSEAHPGHGYGSQFINVGYHDFLVSASMKKYAFAAEVAAGTPQRALSTGPMVCEAEGRYLSYYERVISRMISTVDFKNGFRTEVLSVALSSPSFASKSLLNAILALSSFHLGAYDQAACYKTAAARYLRGSLSSSKEPRLVQMAASMMLCVYSVFDEKEGNWITHLSGAKGILSQIQASNQDNSLQCFLRTWFLYHGILRNFSQPPHARVDNSMLSDLALAETFVDSSMIIGSLGCSLELLGLIEMINQLQGIPGVSGGDTASPKAIIAQRHFVREKLLNLRQHVEVQVSQTDRITTTAEFYRIAALIYLEQTLPDDQKTGNETRDLVSEALKLLERTQVCTSPWPLFIVALEASTDEERIKILNALDKMDSERRLGNVFAMRRIIEGFWKQQVLKPDNATRVSSTWQQLFDTETSVPCFI